MATFLLQTVNRRPGTQCTVLLGWLSNVNKAHDCPYFYKENVPGLLIIITVANCDCIQEWTILTMCFGLAPLSRGVFYYWKVFEQDRSWATEETGCSEHNSNFPLFELTVALPILSKQCYAMCCRNNDTNEANALYALVWKLLSVKNPLSTLKLFALACLRLFPRFRRRRSICSRTLSLWLARAFLLVTLCCLHALWGLPFVVGYRSNRFLAFYCLAGFFILSSIRDWPRDVSRDCWDKLLHLFHEFVKPAVITRCNDRFATMELNNLSWLKKPDFQERCCHRFHNHYPYHMQWQEVMSECN